MTNTLTQQPPPQSPPQPPAAAPFPPRVRLMEMPLDPVTHAGAIDRVLGGLDAGRGGWVITPNLDQLRLYRADQRLRPMYEKAGLIVADGMPLCWAARVQGTPLPERVAGSELIYTLSDAAAKAGRSIFLLGGNPDTARRAGVELARLYPGLRVAGAHYPPFGFEKSDAEMNAITAALETAAPDIVFVGLGFPKQERLIERVRHALPRAWFLGVGISFSFVCGEVHRAPRWVQRIGLEWVHRMTQEPTRLFRRYVIHDLPFAARLFASAIRNRVRRRAS